MSGSQSGNGIIDKIDNAILKVTKVVSYGAMAYLFFIMVIAFVDVLTAKFLKMSIPNATELIQYGNIVVVFLTIAYVEAGQGHTQIDIISSHYPKWAKKLLSIVCDLLGTIVSTFCGWRAVIQTISKYTTFAKSSDTGFYLWPFALIIAIGFFMLAIVCLWKLIKDFVTREPHEAPHSPEDLSKEGGAVV